MEQSLPIAANLLYQQASIVADAVLAKQRRTGSVPDVPADFQKKFYAFLALYPVDLRLGVMKDMKAANPKVYACALDNDDFIDSYFAAFRSLR